MNSFLSAFTGLCAGIVTGSALCAFYIALGVFSKSAICLGLKNVKMKIAISSYCGGIFGTVITLFNVNLETNSFWPAVFGLFAGIYVGIFIACLADVVNSIPVIKNYGISNNYIGYVFLAFVLGKLSGSLIYWLTGVF